VSGPRRHLSDDERHVLEPSPAAMTAHRARGSASVRLETRRLVIRSFEPGDEAAWLAMVHEPDFGRFLPPGPPATAETFRRMVERRSALERDAGYAVWAVDAKETGAFVGQCGLYPAEWTGPEIELAYHFRAAAQNNGYATEAARAALAYGFSRVGLERVIALVMPANLASRRVAEKAGMQLDGTAAYYGIEGLRKYAAEQAWWTEAGAEAPASV